MCPNPRWLTVGLFAFGGPLWSGCLGSVWRRGVSPFESPLWPLGFCSGYFSLVFMSARTLPLGPIRPIQELARLTSKTGALPLAQKSVLASFFSVGQAHIMSGSPVMSQVAV